MITIYTDGACIPNPGPGGWGFAVFNSDNDCIHKECGGAADTTNNIMEMTAVLMAVEYAKGSPAIIYSDSQYCIKGLNEWRHNWKRKGWKRGMSPLANAELWQELDAAADASKAVFKWIRGHNGDPGNELADRLAEIGRTGEFIDGRSAA